MKLTTLKRILIVTAIAIGPIIILIKLIIKLYNHILDAKLQSNFYKRTIPISKADLECFCNTDITQEITDKLAVMIANEVDNEILDYLNS
jgi:hypothetical protein